MIGRVLAHGNNYSPLEKAYIWLLGMPISGLRIRARRILPLVTDRYKKVLDCGCGEGVFTFEIAKMLPRSEVTGIDIDQEVLNRNKVLQEQIKVNNCKFVYADILNFDHKDTYDLILTVDNLEHIEDDRGALKNLYQAAAPGGTIIVHVPAWERRWVFFKWKANFEVQGHMRQGYKLEQIREKVESAGFKIERAQYTYGWLETVTNNISYLITHADMKNKHLYALAFPFLSVISWFGRNSKPEKGAGCLVVGRK
jgi:SAM-dependent methyltransferase